MKQCKKCLQTKELNEFYKHIKMKDGYLNICIECKKTKQIEIRNNNLEYYQQYDRNRPNKTDRAIKVKEYHQTEKGQNVKKQCYNNYKNNYPEKIKATNKINNAIRNGKIIRPNHCEICNIECKPHRTSF